MKNVTTIPPAPKDARKCNADQFLILFKTTPFRNLRNSNLNNFSYGRILAGWFGLSKMGMCDQKHLNF